MKRVITAAMIAVVAAAGGVGSASAAQSSHGDRQDCRTYSSTTVCGKPKLTEKQRACATSMVQQGMTQRRAEVECLTFD
ncbi:hypothetical protein [Actinomadura rubrisoli]|uniref:Uncharacterized protein n=1 Tax=Actinomadura rubrisoli TaxID=2530368 RepID=A0A4R5CBJ0_9ACTN|nr:hypothetical protein [Actinomadura rubrisoli]TDD94474.1 hypothetical protein E1298_06760 [Actinomadura rubrisoli]